MIFSYAAKSVIDHRIVQMLLSCVTTELWNQNAKLLDKMVLSLKAPFVQLDPYSSEEDRLAAQHQQHHFP